jgi:ankyrin repeat protein
LLHYAVLSGSTAVIGLLLKEPLLQSLINGFDGTSATPLILAVRRNRCDIVNLLLVAGADVNAHDEARIGNTAIREAVDEGNAEIIKLLLGAGADPTITGWMQNNAVHRAQKQYDMNPSPERKAVLELINESLSKRILPRRPVSAD